MTDVQPRPTWAILRHRAADDVLGAVFIWALFAVVITAIGAAIAVFGTIATSVWEQASQLPRWFAGGVGVYFTAVYLPLYVAHGQTRREFAVQIVPVMLLFTGTLAVLMSGGFVVETVLYRAFDWPQQLAFAHLYDAPTQLGLVFIEFWLLYSVWTVAGAVVGAGFYRARLLGVGLLLGGLAALAAAETAVGTTGIGPLPALAFEGGTLPVALAVCVGALAIGLVAMWLVVRDMPLRTRDS